MYDREYTPERISDLKENGICVFDAVSPDAIFQDVPDAFYDGMSDKKNSGLFVIDYLSFPTLFTYKEELKALSNR